MLVGLGATVNVAKPKPGSSVSIFGLRVVGLAVYYSHSL
jgi:Zn-dependent alcohol dehydrogenase